MDLDGQGPTGFVHGTGNVTLDQGDGVTSISIEGDAQVEGVALLSSRMIETVARLLVGQFFTAVGLEARDAGEPPS